MSARIKEAIEYGAANTDSTESQFAAEILEEVVEQLLQEQPKMFKKPPASKIGKTYVVVEDNAPTMYEVKSAFARAGNARNCFERLKTMYEGDPEVNFKFGYIPSNMKHRTHVDKDEFIEIVIGRGVKDGKGQTVPTDAHGSNNNRFRVRAKRAAAG